MHFEDSEVRLITGVAKQVHQKPCFTSIFTVVINETLIANGRNVTIIGRIFRNQLTKSGGVKGRLGPTSILSVGAKATPDI